MLRCAVRSKLVLNLDYRHEADKLKAACLTEQPSEVVAPPRVLQCPVQLEAVVESMAPFAARDPRMAVAACAIELRIVRSHVSTQLLTGPKLDRIDTQLWRPLIMSFRQLFQLGSPAAASRLWS